MSQTLFLRVSGTLHITLLIVNLRSLWRHIMTTVAIGATSQASDRVAALLTLDGALIERLVKEGALVL